jgi:hypothetical protein
MRLRQKYTSFTKNKELFLDNTSQSWQATTLFVILIIFTTVCLVTVIIRYIELIRNYKTYNYSLACESARSNNLITGFPSSEDKWETSRNHRRPVGSSSLKIEAKFDEEGVNDVQSPNSDMKQTVLRRCINAKNVELGAIGKSSLARRRKVSLTRARAKLEAEMVSQKQFPVIRKSSRNGHQSGFHFSTAWRLASLKGY